MTIARYVRWLGVLMTFVLVPAAINSTHAQLWTNSKIIFDQLNKEDQKRWREGAPPFVVNFKATPLMVGGRLYLNTPTSIGAALDARTGETLWIYNPRSYEKGTTTMSA